MTLTFRVVKGSYPSIWMHIDAAWAGVTLACPEYRETAQLPGINGYADSLCINFHKVIRSDNPCSNLRLNHSPCEVGVDEFRRISSLGA